GSPRPPKMCRHQVSAAPRFFMFRGNLASLCFPRTTIVQLVIAGTDWKLSLRSRLELVSTAKLGRALVEAILVGATVPRQLVSMSRHAGKYFHHPVSPLVL